MIRNKNTKLRLKPWLFIICTSLFIVGAIFVNAKTSTPDIEKQTIDFNEDILEVKNSKKILKSFKSDTLKGKILPRQGFVSLLKEMGLTNTQSLAIGNNLKEHVDLTTIKLDEPFYVIRELLDSTTKILEFKYTSNKIHQHYLQANEKGELTYKYKKAITVKKYDKIKLVIEPQNSLWSTLKNSTLNNFQTHDLSKALVDGYKLNRKISVGDSIEIFVIKELFEDKIITQKILKVKYYGKRLKEDIVLYYYRENHPKSIYNGYYSADGKSINNAKYHWPVSYSIITCEFGYRRHPITGRRSFHGGLDLQGDIGDPVFAIENGTVITSTKASYSGEHIGIRHPNGYTSSYLHLDKRLVKVGDKVKAGQIIGKLGNTGRSTNAHLHLGIKNARGTLKDPYKYSMYGTRQMDEDMMATFKMQKNDIEFYSKEFDVKPLDCSFLALY